MSWALGIALMLSLTNGTPLALPADDPRMTLFSRECQPATTATANTAACAATDCGSRGSGSGNALRGVVTACSA